MILPETLLEFARAVTKKNLECRARARAVDTHLRDPSSGQFFVVNFFVQLLLGVKLQSLFSQSPSRFISQGLFERTLLYELEIFLNWTWSRFPWTLKNFFSQIEGENLRIHRESETPREGVYTGLFSVSQTSPPPPPLLRSFISLSLSLHERSSSFFGYRVGSFKVFVSAFDVCTSHSGASGAFIGTTRRVYSLSLSLETPLTPTVSASTKKMIFP